MAVSAQGVIKGRQIHLDRETGLPEGVRVRVRIQVPAKRLADKRRRLKRLFGSCSADPSFAAAIAKIERQRHLSPPREVAFDVAS